MDIKICSLVALAFLQILQTQPAFGSPVHCPALSASFTLLIDQTIEGQDFIVADPELTFFRESLGFRDDTIEHTYTKAMTFFNETYGLDFSGQDANERNELFFENAILEPRTIRHDIQSRAVFNNWLLTGRTSTTCKDSFFGELGVRFTGDQLLRGTYGGEDGIMVGPSYFLGYGFYRIDVCNQSPVIIQYQSISPVFTAPHDGVVSFNYVVYNNVLGYGRACGTLSLTPDPDNPAMYNYFDIISFVFP